VGDLSLADENISCIWLSRLARSALLCLFWSSGSLGEMSPSSETRRVVCSWIEE
jgi:hypothetical protein